MVRALRSLGVTGWPMREEERRAVGGKGWGGKGWGEAGADILQAYF